MFGFPQSTEGRRVISKEALFDRIKLIAPATSAQKTMFNADVTSVVIVNTVTADKLAVDSGQKVKGFYVVQVALKNKSFNPKIVDFLFHRIANSMILVLHIGDVCKFAVQYAQHIVVSENWVAMNDFRFEFKGIDLDGVWDSIVRNIAGNPWKENLSIEENLTIREKIAELKKQIESLENKARVENQPARKLDFFNQKCTLEQVLKNLN